MGAGMIRPKKVTVKREPGEDRNSWKNRQNDADRAEYARVKKHNEGVEAARQKRVKAAVSPKSASGKKLTKAQAKKVKQQGKNQRFKTPKGGFQRTQPGRLGRNVHWSE